MTELSPIGPTQEALQQRFSAGSIPTEQDFFDLIDVLYVGWRALATLWEQSGLSFNEEGRLYVAVGRGLRIQDRQIIVEPGNGLEIDDGGVGLKLKPDSGLAVEDGRLKVAPGQGLHVDAAGLSVALGSGLAIKEDRVEIEVGAGLRIAEGKIALEEDLIGTSTLPKIIRGLEASEKQAIYHALSEHARTIAAEDELAKEKKKITDMVEEIEIHISKIMKEYSNPIFEESDEIIMPYSEFKQFFIDIINAMHKYKS